MKLTTINFRKVQIPLLIIFILLAVICDRANPSRISILANDTKIDSFTHNLTPTSTPKTESHYEISNSQIGSNPSEINNIEKSDSSKKSKEGKKDSALAYNCYNSKEASGEEKLICPTPEPKTTITSTPTSETDKIVCTESDGTWTTFSNSCVDYCPVGGDVPICLDVLTKGCDCGTDACWNGTNCVTNPTPTVTPVCGNGICEVDEADIYIPGVCEPTGEPNQNESINSTTENGIPFTSDVVCFGAPPAIIPGTCPADCI